MRIDEASERLAGGAKRRPIATSDPSRAKPGEGIITSSALFKKSFTAFSLFLLVRLSFFFLAF
jgi:hypothetical protein